MSKVFNPDNGEWEADSASSKAELDSMLNPKRKVDVVSKTKLINNKKVKVKSYVPKKILNRAILKETPQATYRIESNPYRNSSFNKAWNKESLAGWK